MSEQMMLESNPGAAESGSPITIDTTMTGLINKYNTYKKSAPGVSEETRIFLKNDLLKSLEDAGISQEEFMMRLSEDTEMRANGGRIGFKKGSDPVYEIYLEDLEAGTIPSDKSYNEYLDDIEEDPDYDYSYAKGGRVSRKLGSPEEGERNGVMEMLAVEVGAGGDEKENMLMAYTPGFSSQEKSYLFRRMGASGGAERSYTMPQLYRILKNPGDYPEDAAVLKEIAVMGLNKKDGGRIGFAFGSPDKKTDIEEELSVDTIYRPTDKPPMLEEMPGGDKMVDIDYTPSFIKDFDKDLDKLSLSKFNKPYVELEILEKEFILEVMKNIGNTVFKADGGRIGYKDGTGSSNRVAQLMLERDYLLSKDEDVSFIDLELERDFWNSNEG